MTDRGEEERRREGEERRGEQWSGDTSQRRFEEGRSACFNCSLTPHLEVGCR